MRSNKADVVGADDYDAVVVDVVAASGSDESDVVVVVVVVAVDGRSTRTKRPSTPS